MKPLGDQFLAGAALADDEDGPVERRGAAGAFDRVEEGQALTDKLGCTLHSQELVAIPTFWQDASHRRSSKRLALFTFSGLSRYWHARCIGNCDWRLNFERSAEWAFFPVRGTSSQPI